MKLKLQVVLQVVTMATGLALGWGSLQASTSNLQKQIDRLDLYGPQALHTYIQAEQDKYTDIITRLSVLTAEVRHQNELLEEMRDNGGLHHKQ